MGSVASWDADALVELRAAAFRRDGAAGFAVLRNRPLAPVLQFAGDLLADALHEGEADAEPLVRTCLDALDGRDAPGDALLAETLRQALHNPPEGTHDAVRPVPADAVQPVPDDGVPSVPVDLGALAYALAEGDAVTILDLHTGDLLAEDELSEQATPHERLVALYRDSASAHNDMHDFAETEPNTPAPMRDAHAYTEALEGTRLELAWSLFREERQRGRARQWLADNGLRLAPRPFL